MSALHTPTPAEWRALAARVPRIPRDDYGYLVAVAGLELGLHETVVEKLCAFAESDSGPTLHPVGSYGATIAGRVARSLIGEARAKCYRRVSMPPTDKASGATPAARRVSRMAFGVDVFASGSSVLEGRLDLELLRWGSRVAGLTAAERDAVLAWEIA